VASSDAVLLQSNHVGITWIPIFTFANHNLADGRVPNILVYVISVDATAQNEFQAMVIILEVRA